MAGTNSHTHRIAVALALLLLAACATFGAHARAESPKCVSLCEPKEEIPPVDYAHAMLLLNVGWNSSLPAADNPLVPANLTEFQADIAGRVNKWFHDASGGIHHDWEVFAGGNYTINPPAVLNGDGICTGGELGAFDAEVANQADAAYKATHDDLGQYETIAYVSDQSFCGINGVSFGGNRVILINPESIMHELGHRYGLPHAQTLSCTDGGNPAPLSFSCAVNEDADPFDMMSSKMGVFNAAYQSRLGWMPGQVSSLAGGDYTQTVNLKPIIEPGQGTRAVRIVDGPVVLWLEYRRPGPLETRTEFSPGVFIHVEESGGHSQLLDMTPSTELLSWLDPALKAGKTWVNPLGEMKYAVNSVTPAAATVTISSKRVTVPDMEGWPELSALSTIRDLGLNPVKSSAPDANCNYIGSVMNQSPKAGARLLPGASVSVTIGKIDKKHPCS